MLISSWTGCNRGKPIVEQIRRRQNPRPNVYFESRSRLKVFNRVEQDPFSPPPPPPSLSPLLFPISRGQFLLRQLTPRLFNLEKYGSAGIHDFTPIRDYTHPIIPVRDREWATIFGERFCLWNMYVHTVKKDFFLIDKSFVNRVMHRKGYFHIFGIFECFSLRENIKKINQLDNKRNSTPNANIILLFFSIGQP